MAVKRINLWSCPRNVSTAFMYSFAQREDTRVWDEPLYGHFLKTTGVARPDREYSMSVMELDGEKVIRDTLLGATDKPVAFFKHITNQLIQIEPHFLSKMDSHILFIRDPREIIQSYSKVIPRPTMEDVAIRRSVALYRKLRTLRLDPIVLNSRDLLKQPEKILKLLCEKLQIPWDPAMLHWEAGPIAEDGPWAKYWYEGVHKSTGFAPYRPREVSLSPYQENLAAQCASYYNYLESVRMR